MDFTQTESEYLISLLRAMLNGCDVPAMPEGLDLTRLYRLSQFHSVANIVYYSLESVNADIPQPLAKQWSELRDKSIMSDIMFQTNYEELCEAFRANGVRFLPLKGILMKDLYPQSDHRTMSDIDILIDPENADNVCAIMRSLGYETADFGHDVHDVYHKPPVTSIEAHRELFGAEGQEYAPLFADPWAMCESNDGCVYQFTAESFFMFLLAHGMKHYAQGGTGIRTFMDIHVYLDSFGEQIDLQRIYEIFGRVGQRKLCESFIALSDAWFGNGERTDALTEMERYILSGGTYGTFSNQVENAIKTKGRTSYIWSKLFPDLRTMKQRYPILKKAPVLLPVMWAVRIVTKPFANRNQNKEKIKALLKK